MLPSYSEAHKRQRKFNNSHVSISSSPKDTPSPTDRNTVLPRIPSILHLAPNLQYLTAKNYTGYLKSGTLPPFIDGGHTGTGLQTLPNPTSLPSVAELVGSPDINFCTTPVKTQKPLVLPKCSSMGQTTSNTHSVQQHHTSLNYIPRAATTSGYESMSIQDVRQHHLEFRHSMPSNLRNMPHLAPLAPLPIDSSQAKENSRSNKQESKNSKTPATEHSSPLNFKKRQYEHSAITNEKFAKYIPLLRKVNSLNFGAFLAQLLNEWHHHVTIDDVFNLLYNENVEGIGDTSGSQVTQIDKSKSSKLKQHALQLCHLVLETFKDPGAGEVFPNGSIEYFQLSSINFHELVREFLAIKIILSAIRKSRNSTSSSSSIARLSVYKVYYILCQKLIQRYPVISACQNQNIIMGQSQLGKITKVAYPNLIAKRLGRRGESKFHFINIKWNKTIVDENILTLIDLDIPQIEEYFRTSTSLK